MAQKDKKAKKFVQIVEKSLNNINLSNLIKNYQKSSFFGDFFVNFCKKCKILENLLIKNLFNNLINLAQNSIVGGENMIIANIIASILVIIGAINWGLVGIFNWNLVNGVFGAGLPVGAVIVYVLILLSAIWLIIACVMQRGRISYRRDY